ncbi:hypothetical protein [Nocardia sp. NBC_01329]|uniref:hypothetical protein n=1 Tax=Nocardia sp. NBC_01329 TaxID=2903594 RepID=UPI002E0DBA30|nr:hypothetical protein OG405_03955 [Nocardia sp. NBC_01329]
MSGPDNFLAPKSIESLARVVAEFADEIYLSLTTIGTALRDLWNDLTDERRPAVRSADLASLREMIVAELGVRGELFDGTGVIMADGVLADRPLFLEWWLSDAVRGPQRHMLELNPQSEYFYDYTLLDWYVIPRDRRRRWVEGPRIDFACSDQYVCTFTIPVESVPGEFLGVAGADVPVAAMEKALLPAFRASNPRATLVNSEGRVILGVDPEFPPGSRIGRGDRSDGVPVDALPWSLLPQRGSARRS